MVGIPARTPPREVIGRPRRLYFLPHDLAGSIPRYRIVVPDMTCFLGHGVRAGPEPVRPGSLPRRPRSGYI